jgi:hypothetical protein
MDPGGIGALIGIGAMIFIARSFFFHDKCKKNRKQKEKKVLSSTPLLVSSERKRTNRQCILTEEIIQK